MIRRHAGPRRAAIVIAVLLVANIGTMCAELAGVAAGADLLFGTPAGSRSRSPR